MINELREKRDRLNALKPFEVGLRRKFDLLSSLDLFYGGLVLRGSGLSMADAAKILGDEAVLSASIEEHLLARRYDALKRMLISRAEMDYSADEKLLSEVYGIIFEEEAEYREPKEAVRKKLREFFSLAEEARAAKERDEAADAAKLLLAIAMISPYTKENDELARIMAEYYLFREGYPFFLFQFSRAEYRAALDAAIEGGDISKMESGIKRSLYNRLSSMIQLAEGE